MQKYFLFTVLFSLAMITKIVGQNKADSIAIKQLALDYIESQHKPNSTQMGNALHPRMVKRTFWKDKGTGKDFLYEYFAENMVILAERYNIKGDRFPANPKKEVQLLDVSERTASIKLIADEWIDYMHAVKLNGKWTIVNVLWQYNDQNRHQ